MSVENLINLFANLAAPQIKQYHRDGLRALLYMSINPPESDCVTLPNPDFKIALDEKTQAMYDTYDMTREIVVLYINESQQGYSFKIMQPWLHGGSASVTAGDNGPVPAKRFPIIDRKME